jgi:hypothetical protein
MSVSKRDLANKELCQQVVTCYLSEEKPTIKEVGSRFGVSFHTAAAMLEAALSEEKRKQEAALRYSRSKQGEKNPMLGKTGASHPLYRGRLECDPHGYILILKPDWYTGRPGSKHVYEHQAVMAKLLGLTEVPENMQVHHINEDRADNSPENLALVTPVGHRTLHSRSPLRQLTLWELHRSGTSRSRKTIATSPTA